ncbi:MAG: cytochrome c peroxidase [Chitinophagaceae bacterium]|nr:cytochrome c peroxidase [Chitinophagaceae bacterium]
MKWRITISFVVLIAMFIAGGEACRKKDVVAKPTPMEFKVPDGFPQPENIFSSNPLTKEGFELGRKLFYDGRLSKDGNFPCASCHQQFAAFATFDHDLSHGFNNQFTTRNSPGLFNLAWHKELHWDGGINHIEVQPLAPITAPNEMAETVDNVINKLKADEQYQKMFKAAFGDADISSQRMLKAIAQFVGFITSAGSKYDKVKKGTAAFTTAEQSGYSIFKANCASCHAEPLFTDLTYRNTGLPLRTSLNDIGRMRITNKPEDSLKFKVPSLRNVDLTYPYTHDGRFYSLSTVIDHYRTGVVNGPTTDPLVKNKIPLSDLDKSDLIAFLRTLTDNSLLNDKRFSQPQ